MFDVARVPYEIDNTDITIFESKMSLVPVMLDPKDRSVLVVGDSETAHRRLAQVRRWTERVRQVPALTPDLLADAALVFVSTDDAHRDGDLAAMARAAGVPVHVHDRPDLGTVAMPAVVERGDVLVAISTRGTAPVLARRLKETIDQLLPARLGALTRLLDSFRGTVRAVLPGFELRRRFWEGIVDGPAGAAALAGNEAKARELIVAALNGRGTRERAGVVHLVGGGPGDPELLTLKAHRVLQDADVILHDELIGPGILERVRQDARRIHVGKQKGRHTMAQGEINALMIALAREGKRVARLKGGDPFVFGRGGEELEALRAAGIETHVVPGITAAAGCAASAGFPLTHRDIASSLTFVTGHGKDGEPTADWHDLAASGSTLAIYMGLTHAGVIARSLTEAGMRADTPAAVIVNGTRENERVVTGTLSSLPMLAAREGGKGPALIVVGDIVRLAPAWSEANLLEAAS